MKSHFIYLNASVFALFCIPSTISFGPVSAPKKNNLNNLGDTTIDVERISDKATALNDDDTSYLDALKVNERVIRNEYNKWFGFGFDNSDVVTRFDEFKKTFVETMDKALKKPSKTNGDDKETVALASSLGIDEIIVRQEYEKWLDRYDKVADETRYPQFKKNFLIQFKNDLVSGEFYTLNEFGDCKEAEATTQLMNVDEWGSTLQKENDKLKTFPEILKATEKLENKIEMISAAMKIRDVTVETIVDAQEIDARERDAEMFTLAVQNDIYNIFRAPYNVGQEEGVPDQVDSSIFGAVLLEKESPSGKWDTYAFADRQTYYEKNLEQLGYYALSDDDMLQAIDMIGKIDPLSLAVTRAFEYYLSQLSQEWENIQASSFSDDFLAAFGRELPERFSPSSKNESERLTEEKNKGSLIKEEMTVSPRDDFAWIKK